MAFDPKMVLAGNVDGLSGKRVSRAWIILVVLLALLPLGFWAYGNVPRLRALFRMGKAEPLPKATLDVFSKMSLMSQGTRVAAPDFFLRTPEGQNHSLSQHKGQVVLLNFWATWCPPCIREMPAMERLYREYKGKGLEIVAVSLDQGKLDEVRAFAERLKLTFPVVLDPAHDVKGVYRVRALPTTYVLDREGRIIAWGMGAREWDSPEAHALVRQLLGVKKKTGSGSAAAPSDKRG